MTDFFTDQLYAWIIANGGSSSLALVLFGSLYVNYRLFRSFYNLKQNEKEYCKLLKILEPILNDIIDGKTLTKTQKCDLMRIRDIIKYSI